MQTLKNDIYAVEISGSTGQQIHSGKIHAGTLVKNVRDHGIDSEGELLYRFESSKNGERWYTRQSYEQPVVE